MNQLLNFQKNICFKFLKLFIKNIDYIKFNNITWCDSSWPCFWHFEAMYDKLINRNKNNITSNKFTLPSCIQVTKYPLINWVQFMFRNNIHALLILAVTMSVMFLCYYAIQSLISETYAFEKYSFLKNTFSI